MAVRWYVAYALSYRDIEELMLERGIAVDHATINRWIIKYAPQLEPEFRNKHKKQVGSSWRMVETYVKIKGKWYYLYRAVDKYGLQLISFYKKSAIKKRRNAFLKKRLIQMDCLKQ